MKVFSFKLLTRKDLGEMQFYMKRITWYCFVFTANVLGSFSERRNFLLWRRLRKAVVTLWDSREPPLHLLIGRTFLSVLDLGFCVDIQKKIGAAFLKWIAFLCCYVAWSCLWEGGCMPVRSRGNGTSVMGWLRSLFGSCMSGNVGWGKEGVTHQAFVETKTETFLDREWTETKACQLNSSFLVLFQAKNSEMHFENRIQRHRGNVASWFAHNYQCFRSDQFSSCPQMTSNSNEPGKFTSIWFDMISLMANPIHYSN